MATTIRDLREKKMLSQDAVAAAAGVSYSVFCRIEAGTGKTTRDEVKHVLAVLKEMEPGTRKLAGRPFKDPAVQAAVLAAREQGGSVAAAIASAASPAEEDDLIGEAPAPAKKARVRKPRARKEAS